MDSEHVHFSGVWACEWCDTTIYLHPDPGHESQIWARNEMAHHDHIHRLQLAEHGGDRERLRRRLTNPALAAALAGITPEVEDSIPEAS